MCPPVCASTSCRMPYPMSLTGGEHGENEYFDRFEREQQRLWCWAIGHEGRGSGFALYPNWTGIGKMPIAPNGSIAKRDHARPSLRSEGSQPCDQSFFELRMMTSLVLFRIIRIVRSSQCR